MSAAPATHTLLPPLGWIGDPLHAAAEFAEDYALCLGSTPTFTDAAALALRLPTPLDLPHASLAKELGRAWEGWALQPLPALVRLQATLGAPTASGAPLPTPEKIQAWASRVRAVQLQPLGALAFACSAEAAGELLGQSHRVLGTAVTFAPLAEARADPGAPLQPQQQPQQQEPSPAAAHLSFSWCLVVVSFSLLLLVEARWGGWGGSEALGVHRRPLPPRPPAHVFIDIGTNNGLSVLRFLSIPGVGPVSDPTAPSRAGFTWHIALFEANPVHVERMEDLTRDIVEFGHTAEMHAPVAIAPTNGTNITFFLDNWQAGTYAATTVPGALSSSGETLVVPTVSLDFLCRELVLGGLREEDYVVVKVDIEGAEYDVLLGAIAAGVPRLWDELYVEWHELNAWVLKGTPMGAVGAEKHARVLQQLAEGYPRLKVGEWDRRRA